MDAKKKLNVLFLRSEKHDSDKGMNLGLFITIPRQAAYDKYSATQMASIHSNRPRVSASRTKTLFMNPAKSTRYFA